MYNSFVAISNASFNNYSIIFQNVSQTLKYEL